MKHIYSLQDSKTGELAAPFVMHNDEAARRAIGDALTKSPDIPPAQYPDDYALVRLGDWDEVDGISAPCREFICSCVTLLADIEARRARVNSQIKNNDVSDAIQSK